MLEFFYLLARDRIKQDMSQSTPIFQVFVSPGCQGCERARELAAWVRETKPQLEVAIIDLAVEPDAGLGLVFGVPTYVFDGKTVFFGESISERTPRLVGPDPLKISITLELFNDERRAVYGPYLGPRI